MTSKGGDMGDRHLSARGFVVATVLAALAGACSGESAGTDQTSGGSSPDGTSTTVSVAQTSTTTSEATSTTIPEATSTTVSVPATCDGTSPGLPVGIETVVDCAGLIFHDDLATFEVSAFPFTTLNWWAGPDAYLGVTTAAGQVFDSSQVISEQSGIRSSRQITAGQAAIFEYSFPSEGVFAPTIDQGDWSTPDFRSWAIYMTPSGPTVVRTVGPNDATSTCCDDVIGASVPPGRYYVLIGIADDGEMIGAYWPVDGSAAPVTRVDDLGEAWAPTANWNVIFHVWQSDSGEEVTLHSFTVISHSGLIP
jgi:hypothetical protein